MKKEKKTPIQIGMKRFQSFEELLDNRVSREDHPEYAEYVLTSEEFQQLHEVSKNNQPVVGFVGSAISIQSSKQEEGKTFWKRMAEKYKFEFNSVRPDINKPWPNFLAIPL